MTALMPEVDLVVNMFERTYREVLQPETFDRIAADNQLVFARRVALVNNVDDPDDARRRAQPLLESGAISELRFVADHLSDAMRVTGITERDLGRTRHYTDCAIVAVTLPGAAWLLYWDADVRLDHPFDWITPSIELMESDERILIANPDWTPSTLEQEAFERHGPFALGYGFSDQVFLVRRADLSQPIYHQRCVASLRYPIAHVGYVFEARVDSWMRHHERLRATHTGVRYVHPAEDAGASHPPGNAIERLRKARNQLVIAALARSPWKPRCARGMYL